MGERIADATVPAEKVPATLLAAARERIDAARAQEPELWHEILAESRIAASIGRVWACSEFVATSSQRHAEMLRQLVRDGRLFERAADDWIAQDLASHPTGDSEPEMAPEIPDAFLPAPPATPPPPG